MRLLDRLSEHEALPRLISDPALAPAVPVITAVQEKSILKNPLMRLALRGRAEVFMPAGIYEQTGAFAAAWDSGFLSPLLRFLPFFSRFVTFPGLYYVQAGKLSRFEYRTEGGKVIYIGSRRNLLVICNDQKIFEALISGAEDPFDSGDDEGFFERGSLNPARYDAVFLFSPSWLSGILAEQNEDIAGVLKEIVFPSFIEAGFSVSPDKLELHLSARASSGNPAFAWMLEQRSQIPNIAEMLPAASQYSTILSVGSLSQLYDAAVVFTGPSLDDSLMQADRSSGLILGMNLEELIFSWPGTEFAVIGLEGRPHPVYAIQIADERKRQEVFNRAFKTIAINENVQLNLDGMRIPRIEVPDFLQALLRRWDIRLPSPYYTVHRDFLLASESAEALLSAVRAIQRNDVLPGSQAWRYLAGQRSEASAFSLYYSLDRSLPFFLRGNTTISSILGVYRQGLARMAFDRNTIKLSLSMIPGSGQGLTPASGYPLSVGRNPHNQVYGILSNKPTENRLIMIRDGAAISINTADNTIYEMEGQRQGNTWIIPAEGFDVKSADDPCAWVVSAQGRVTLVNGNMETEAGFPLSTGLRLSAQPAAHRGLLFLSGEDGRVLTVDSKGAITHWETAFFAALRSPPSFLQRQGSQRNITSLAAVYPKSFLGEIWILDTEGRALPGWPVPVSGIAFGSPVLFAHNRQTLAAFVTQAGELTVYDEGAAVLPPFPVEIDGVFLVQPVFDGEYLWLISAGGDLFRAALNGEVLQHNIPNFSAREEGFIVTHNIDGSPAVFVTGDGNALYGYTRNFRALEGFPLPIWGQPFFGDLNGNGKTEIAGVGMDRLLYRWQFK